MMVEGCNLPNSSTLADYKISADKFICSCIQRSKRKVLMTPGGLLYFNIYVSLSHVTSSMLLMASYADSLLASESIIQCEDGFVNPYEMINFVRSQVKFSFEHCIIICMSSCLPSQIRLNFGAILPAKIPKK